MASKTYFKIAGLTQEHKAFLKDYAYNSVGKNTISAGILALIDDIIYVLIS